MIHLHGHSTYSFLESIGKPKDIVAKAVELGMSAIAITDYNGCNGLIDLYQKAKAAEIKPLMGVELSFVLDLNTHMRAEQIGTLCFLAKNENGYHNVLRLASYANMEGLGDTRRVDSQALQNFKEDVMVFMGGERSRIGKMITNGEPEDKIKDTLKIIIDIFGTENTYLEIVAQDYSKLPAIKKINEMLLKLAEEFGLQKIIGNNYHYLEKNEKPAREMALAIRDGYKMYDEQRRKPKGDYHIMSEKEITMIMKKNGFTDEDIQALYTTNQTIADSIEIDIELWKTLFPNYQTPEDIQSMYDKFQADLVEKK